MPCQRSDYFMIVYCMTHISFFVILISLNPLGLTRVFEYLYLPIRLAYHIHSYSIQGFWQHQPRGSCFTNKVVCLLIAANGHTTWEPVEGNLILYTSLGWLVSSSSARLSSILPYKGWELKWWLDC